MIVTRETATVYRGGGRRWLTKASAIRAEAKARINARCACEPYDRETGAPASYCRYHTALEDPDSWARRFRRRYLRFLTYFAGKNRDRRRVTLLREFDAWLGRHINCPDDVNEEKCKAPGWNDPVAHDPDCLMMRVRAALSEYAGGAR